MILERLLTGTLRIIPKTSDRWKTRVVRLEGKRVDKQFNSVYYRGLVSGGKGVYSMHMMFSESNLGTEGKPTKHAKCRVKCSCKAYRFWFAWANWKGDAFYGNPDRWAKTASLKHNTGAVPGMCKHLCAFTYILLNNGEIRTDVEKTVRSPFVGI